MSAVATVKQSGFKLAGSGAGVNKAQMGMVAVAVGAVVGLM